MGSELSKEFLVQVVVQQGSVLSSRICLIVVNAFIEWAREGLTNEILYADDLALTSKILKKQEIKKGILEQGNEG